MFEHPVRGFLSGGQQVADDGFVAEASESFGSGAAIVQRLAGKKLT
jgi:hypothetical protein